MDQCGISRAISPLARLEAGGGLAGYGIAGQAVRRSERQLAVVEVFEIVFAVTSFGVGLAPRTCGGHS